MVQKEHIPYNFISMYVSLYTYAFCMHYMFVLSLTVLTSVRLCPSLILYLIQSSMLTVGTLTVGDKMQTVKVTAKEGSEVNGHSQNRQEVRTFSSCFFLNFFFFQEVK